ncbi:MAG: hypothetical protein AAF916_04160 [Planctomycetota bacterium]
MAADIDTAVVTCIRLCAPVLALVVDRVRPVALAQTDIRPAITYEPVDEDNFGGVDGSRSEITLTTFDLDIYADSYSQARDIARDLREHLDHEKFIVDDLECIWFCDGSQPVHEKPTDGAPAPIYHFRQTYRLQWRSVA